MTNTYYYVAFRRNPGFAPFKKPEPQYGEIPREIQFSRDSWVSFVESQKATLTWWKDTEEGIRATQIEGNPFQKALDLGLVVGECDKKTGFYKFAIEFDLYRIRINFDGMRPNKRCLLLCHQLAQFLGAKLFKLGHELSEELIAGM